jgi:hypothetical protein
MRFSLKTLEQTYSLKTGYTTQRVSTYHEDIIDVFSFAKLII